MPHPLAPAPSVPLAPYGVLVPLVPCGVLVPLVPLVPCGVPPVPSPIRQRSERKAAIGEPTSQVGSEKIHLLLSGKEGRLPPLSQCPWGEIVENSPLTDPA